MNLFLAGHVSFKDIPGAFTETDGKGSLFNIGRCNHSFSVAVEALEYINAENIAVTVLRSAPTNRYLSSMECTAGTYNDTPTIRWIYKISAPVTLVSSTEFLLEETKVTDTQEIEIQEFDLGLDTYPTRSV